MRARTLIATLATIAAASAIGCSPRHKDKTHASIAGSVSQDSKVTACSSAEGQWQFVQDMGLMSKLFQFKRTEARELVYVGNFDRGIVVDGKTQEAVSVNVPVKATAVCTDAGNINVNIAYANGDSDKMEFQIGADQTSGTLIISSKRGQESLSGSQIFQKVPSAPIQAKAN